MYFPENMTFQYFFFNTYPGYFLQALPIALTGGMIYVIWRSRRAGAASGVKTVLAALFVCYLTGLLCLTLLEYPMGQVYYFLFYHMPSGRNWTWFNLTFNFVPDFFRRFGEESLGNIVLYLPYGILYPLFREKSTWKRTLLAGVGTSVVIEILQPLFGRSFDVNDIILNGIGVVLSTAVFYGVRTVIQKK